MGKFQKGDIYLSWFPFTSYQKSKIRPVVVLVEDKTYQDVVVLAISSVLSGWDPFSVIYVLSEEKDFNVTGFKKDSCILVNRIATIRADRLFYHLGRLPAKHIQKIDERFLNNFQIGDNEEKGQAFIPYGKQSIDTQDVYSVLTTLRSDFLTQGPKIPEFEQTVANYCGAKHAIAVNSATSALHIACLALDLGPGDSLWTTPITFVASANCGLYCGAQVDFVDIDPHTYNLCPDKLQQKLKTAIKNDKLPKIVIPVHMCGQPCDMQAIHALAQEYGFKIIEDASHAIGGRYQNQPIGNCRYSDITIFSFHPVKIITTGEGGLALTNDPQLAEQMTLLRSHGITRDPARMTHEPDGPWYYQQVDLGFNYRMTDIQASLGLSQMQRLDELVQRRAELATRYDTLLAGLPVTTPLQHPDGSSAWHLYVIRLQQEKINKSHRQVFEFLRSMGIGVNLHYIPVHTQLWYRKLGFEPGMFTESEKYYQEAITLPLFPNMTGQVQDKIVRDLNEALEP